MFCYQLVYSTKNEKIILPASVSASVINVLANVVLIPLLLQNGAVIASVLSELITNVIQFVYIKRKIKFPLSLKPILSSLVSTLFMAVSVLVIMKASLSSTVGLFIEIACGGTVYILSNFIFKNTLLFEIIEKVKEKFKLKRRRE